MKNPNRVKAGFRSAEVRSERRDAFLYEIENTRPELLDLARKMERMIPTRLDSISRVEWFLEYAEENPDAGWDVAQARADREVADLVAEYMAGAAA